MRATDQACCAVMLSIALGLMIATWLYQGGLRGRIIDVEKAQPQTVLFQLDINRAGWPEWSVLPEIGEMLAKRIIATRESNGPYRSHDDLLRVHGIGRKTLDRIRPYLLPVEGTGPMTSED